MRDSDEVEDLAHFRKYNQNKLDVAHLNINFLRNKFELLTEKTKGNVDILVISETRTIEASRTVNSKLIVLATPIE